MNMKAYLLCLVLCLIIVRPSTSCTVNRRLMKNGFHRDLETKLLIPAGELLPDVGNEQLECRAKVRETIPAGSYIDPFQLKELEHFGGPKVFMSSTIDLEQPEYTSSPFEADIFMNLSLQHSADSWAGNYTLPIHVRYHAVSNEEYVTFTIPQPEVALFCRHKHQDKVLQAYSGLSLGQIEYRCDSDTDQLCKWTLVQCHMENAPVTVTVPVGQKHHLHLVTIATVATTLLGCYFLSKKKYTQYQ